MHNNNEARPDSEVQTVHHIALNEEVESFKASPDISVLVAMERAGQRLIPVGCRGGGCGKCRIRIVQGEYFSKRMSRAWISPEQEAEGTVLACRVFARSDLVIEPDPPEIGTSCHAADQSGQ
ncbi:2Fe-2S iron-sulfur cluster binding domain-containing protein [Marinobacterium sediminicola]|uniref:Ferredoxin n=1 Tax=Marinobacterium sediminicola TaxID=518898 RepID=A0ABY1S135_9GAMM|nr:2Fe-2S iron-sulfur cluster binding domain-containing protein [Marinobacterium sediminicola]ULG68344.1 2Fe-2S iron-sulfur cluster binding domain-containing protein [Marinobacterium sediminicola]SMR74777.1 Ferredoxin [Marinobacterium sediminicola]